VAGRLDRKTRELAEREAAAGATTVARAHTPPRDPIALTVDGLGCSPATIADRA
jgi:hypothetical protein